MKIENSCFFCYPPEDIRDFYIYRYEWIDVLDFQIGFVENNETKAYLNEAKNKFLSCGWEGDGEIGLIWMPPFVLNTVIKGGSEKFIEKYGTESWKNGILVPTSWTRGVLIWHVKQTEGGLSYLLSPLELNISSYALD